LGDAASVWGSVSRSGELQIDVEDQAEVGLTFASGALASVHLDYLQQPAAHWLEVICSKGALHWDAGTGVLRVTFHDGAEQEYQPPTDFDRNDLFLAQMQHFLDMAGDNAQPICSLEDGIQALAIVLAARQSAETGKRTELIN
jgi:predicted dehydrogenase